MKSHRLIRLVHAWPAVALQKEAGVGAAGTVGSIAQERMQRAFGESSRRNWYVRVRGYAVKVSLVKMRGFRKNYISWKFSSLRNHFGRSEFSG